MATTTDEHVPVLIVGGGYAGLASSLFLSHHGVRSLLVDRHPGVSVQGRARGINQRTMEIYQPLGLEEAIRQAGTPFTGEWEWLLEQDAPSYGPDLSPAASCMADQNTVEPILIETARRQGGDQRFNTQMVSFETDADGVGAVLEDRASGRRRTVRADYLIAADGHRSPIREQPGIARPGPGITQHWVSIVFDADLSDVVRRRALFWIVLNPQLGFAAFATTATPGALGGRHRLRPGEGVAGRLHRRALRPGGPRRRGSAGPRRRDRRRHALGAGDRRGRPLARRPGVPRR